MSATLLQSNYSEFLRANEEYTKTVNVTIASKDLTNLKGSGYNLCFAKKVGDTYNVIWSSSFKYLVNNSFNWTPVYELFGSNVFQGGVTVKTATDNRRCQLGQTCTMNEVGILSTAVDGGPPTTLTFNNEYGDIHPGVNQVITDIEGNVSSNPIYVAENNIVLGTDELTPKESVQIWFEQHVETSTMISKAVSNKITIDLTSVNTGSVKYENGTWSAI